MLFSHIVENEVDGTCVLGGERRHGVLLGKAEGKRPLGDLGADVRVVLY